MGDVYANTALTIMAVAATSANTGCFVKTAEKTGDPGHDEASDRFPCELGSVHLDTACETHLEEHDFPLFGHHNNMTA
jgi:hypothetical protein